MRCSCDRLAVAGCGLEATQGPRLDPGSCGSTEDQTVHTPSSHTSSPSNQLGFIDFGSKSVWFFIYHLEQVLPFQTVCGKVLKLADERDVVGDEHRLSLQQRNTPVYPTPTEKNQKRVAENFPPPEIHYLHIQNSPVTPKHNFPITTIPI